MDNQLLDEGLLNRDAEPVELEMASQGKRFGTFVIDRILSFGLSMIIALLYFAINPDAAERLEANNAFAKVIDYALGYLSLFIYYTFFEAVCNGRTIGKIICGTRALTVDGEIMDAGTVVKRTLCRMVPFDAFSFLGAYANGWHDRWSDTMVVNEADYQQSLR